MKKSLLILLISMIATTAFAQRGNRAPRTWQEQLDEKYTSGLFRSVDGTYFDMTNDAEATGANAYLNILDWLQGRVAGLRVYTTYRNTRLPYLRNLPAAVFLDEMRIDAGFLNTLPVSDIAMIKIIKTPFMGGWGAAGGAIAIYTKDGEEDEAVEE